MQVISEDLVIFSDNRGSLFKLFGEVTGEVYAVSLEPGSDRGHHLHKKASEVFACINGEATLIVQDPSTGSRMSIDLAGKRAVVPAGIAHAIVSNKGALIVASMDRAHDPLDVIPFKLELP